MEDRGNGGELAGFAEADTGGGAGLAHAAAHIANKRANLTGSARMLLSCNGPTPDP
jgi:hypothetical protein